MWAGGVCRDGIDKGVSRRGQKDADKPQQHLRQYFSMVCVFVTEEEGAVTRYMGASTYKVAGWYRNLILLP